MGSIQHKMWAYVDRATYCPIVYNWMEQSEGSDEFQEVERRMVARAIPGSKLVTNSIRTSGANTNTLVPLIFSCPSLDRATQSASTVPWQCRTPPLRSSTIPGMNRCDAPMCGDQVVDAIERTEAVAKPDSRSGDLSPVPPGAA